MQTFLTLCQQIFVSDKIMDASFKEFTTILLRHSVERPPNSAAVFSGDDVSEIVDALLSNYYRHWCLYKDPLPKLIAVSKSTS